ncbi:MAG TPA: hypothetical protein VGL58_08480 [Caulobacteraceae bacterium]|jgi:hypothetical protein
MTPSEALAAVCGLIGAEAQQRSGSVFYSGLDTLREGEFYLMGFNPGGDVAKHADRTIERALPQAGPWSAYEDDCWQDECAGLAQCPRRPPGWAMCPKVHQRRVREILGVLGETPRQVFATNCVFVRSPTTETLAEAKDRSWEDICWPAHQWFLGIVRPQVIVTLGKGFGRTAFCALMNRAGVQKNLVTTLGEGGSTDARVFVGRFDLGGGVFHAATVIGVPHPSRFQMTASSRDALGKAAKRAGDGISLDDYLALTDAQRAAFHSGA